MTSAVPLWRHRQSTEFSGEYSVLNPTLPALITQGVASSERSPYYLDHFLADGWYG